MEFEIQFNGPYNLTRSAWFIGQLPTDGADIWTPARETLPAEYRRLHNVEGRPVLIMARQETGRDRGNSSVLVRTFPERPGNASILKEVIEWQFHADTPLEAFYRRARKHPVLASVVKSLYGVRPLRPPTLFEMAVVAVTEQQLSYVIAVQMRSRLVQALGRKIAYEGKEYHAFPTPDALARSTVEDLRKFAFSTRKSEYIIEMSRQVASGKLDIESLRNRRNEEVAEVLTALRGFGRWSVEYFLGRGLGRHEVVAGGDLRVQTLVGKYLGPGHRVDEKETRRIMEEWGPYKRWVVFYLSLASRVGLLL
ncbi:MAG TPA: hypothetical protein VLS90_07220 [Thermodesulfobacteriota bacterium]|nr:hypothetical protein [Thermodesulfobacteriota bacterium]